MRDLRIPLIVSLFVIGASPAFTQSDGPPRPEELDPEDGVATIPSREAYERLSYQGDAGRDAYLNDIQFVKFQLENAGSDKAQLYFMNTKRYRAHPRFMQAIGIRRFGRGRSGGNSGPGRQMRGAIAYHPRVRAPDGSAGVYTYDFQPNDSFPLELLEFCQRLILEKAPFLKGKLVYHPLRGGLEPYEREKEKYAEAKITVYLDDDLEMNLGFLPLNRGATFGRLRIMKSAGLPTPRDVVLYRSLPNELPRVAGIITEARQTPLSHVNLRAIQDGVPNAFVTGATKNSAIAPLVGKWVRYEVSDDGFEIREAEQAEVDTHFESIRPKARQTPSRDLSVTEMRPLAKIGFADSSAYGVKAANVGAMRTFGLPEGIVPDGFGVPFHFYDAFMKHNELYAKARSLFADPAFREDGDHRSAVLARFRSHIRSGDLPDWMFAAVAELERSFPSGTPIRCRSSTNNEDLPRFSGAGLYGSYTHDADDGHLGRTIKKVYASLWSDRAYEEREFYRIDHFAAAMGVLVHPSYKGERANGVVVTTDVLYETDGTYYVNAQVGEDLVTNPDSASVPEEVLLGWWKEDGAKLMQHSNRVAAEKRILEPAHLDVLRTCLGKIHAKFAKLYEVDPEDENFAMEIEFKVAKDGSVAIKQARPWVFPSAPEPLEASVPEDE